MKKRIPVRTETGQLTDDMIVSLISGDDIISWGNPPFASDADRARGWDKHRLYIMTRMARTKKDDLFSHYLPSCRPSAFWDYELSRKRPVSFIKEKELLSELGLLGTDELSQWAELVEVASNE